MCARLTGPSTWTSWSHTACVTHGGESCGRGDGAASSQHGLPFFAYPLHAHVLSYELLAQLATWLTVSACGHTSRLRKCKPVISRGPRQDETGHDA